MREDEEPQGREGCTGADRLSVYMPRRGEVESVEDQGLVRTEAGDGAVGVDNKRTWTGGWGGQVPRSVANSGARRGLTAMGNQLGHSSARAPGSLSISTWAGKRKGKTGKRRRKKNYKGMGVISMISWPGVPCFRNGLHSARLSAPPIASRYIIRTCIPVLSTGALLDITL